MTFWRKQKIRGWLYQFAALLLVASFVCLLVINLIPLLFEKKAKRNG